MALNLNKDSNDKKYYYTENGSTLGPFSLEQLLEKIDADTLVYREGIDWTNACDIEELKKYFKSASKNIPQKKREHENFAVKSNKKYLYPILAIITLILIALIVWFNYFKKVVPVDQVESDGNKVEVKIYANVKKRNKLVVGSLSLNVSNTNFNSCLKEVFGDRFIKYSSYDDSDNALNDLKNQETDILILTADEVSKFKNTLEISESMEWEGISQDVFIAAPYNNSIHINNVTNCFTK